MGRRTRLLVDGEPAAHLAPGATAATVPRAATASVQAGRLLSPTAGPALQRLVGNAAVQQLAVQRDVTIQRDAAAEALAVVQDMSSQFKRWKGYRYNRGAWWGSPRPGDTSGAKNVPTHLIKLVRAEAEKRGWRTEPSWTGGVSFHKSKSKAECDFIYHMQAP